MEYRITQYPLEQGALEIQYIEEFFGEYQRRKTVAEIVGRLKNRDHLILMATAPLPDDPGSVVPVSCSSSRQPASASSASSTQCRSGYASRKMRVRPWLEPCV